jgi:hypothetical protein
LKWIPFAFEKFLKNYPWWAGGFFSRAPRARGWGNQLYGL